MCPPPPLILLRPGVCLFSWVPNTTSRLLLAEENQGRGGLGGNKRQAWLERRASCWAQRDALGGGGWAVVVGGVVVGEVAAEGDGGEGE